MPKAFPPKHDTFLAADNVRLEMGGKTLLVGVYPGNEIRVPRGTLFPVTFPLAFWIVFKEGEGNFETKFRLFNPDERPMTEYMPMGNLEKRKDGPLQLIINLPLITLPSEGKYSVEVLLDERPYRDTFTVAFSPD